MLVLKRAKNRNNSQRGFTLIELMAVVIVIIVMVAIIFGAAGYIQRKTAVSRAKAELAALESALEAYKSDFGYYPVTLDGRVSSRGGIEAWNNWLLVRALFSNSTKYASAGGFHLRDNGTVVTSNGLVIMTRGDDGVTNFVRSIVDPWGNPYNYYHPLTNLTLQIIYPASGNITNSGYTVGSPVSMQVRYELFSYGPDGVTYAGAVGTPYWTGRGWGSAPVDDVTNWEP